MALPASGPISGSQIGTEFGLLSGPYSLHSLSVSASFSTPDSMSEFYSHRLVYFTFCDYIGSDSSGFVPVSVVSSENVNTDVTFYWYWIGSGGSFLYGNTVIYQFNSYGITFVGGAYPNEYYSGLYVYSQTPSSFGIQTYSTSYSYCY